MCIVANFPFSRGATSASWPQLTQSRCQKSVSARCMSWWDLHSNAYLSGPGFWQSFCPLWEAAGQGTLCAISRPSALVQEEGSVTVLPVWWLREQRKVSFFLTISSPDCAGQGSTWRAESLFAVPLPRSPHLSVALSLSCVLNKTAVRGSGCLSSEESCSWRLRACYK